MTTKKIIICIIALTSFISVSAKDADAITMVSYEQSWLDMEGTLALKNNTNEEIKNVVFLITYLDMSGNELDYEEFSRRVNIAPGMTKKLDVPAYEHSRNYHYYKSENRPSGSPAFKIKFQLKDYNVEEEIAESIDDVPFDRYDYDRSTEKKGIYLIMIIVGLLFFIGITVGLYVLVPVMAKKRNRNEVVWILLSLLASPLLMIIILLFIGKDESKNYEQHYNK